MQMTPGIRSSELTPECVAAELDKLMDTNNAQLIGVNADIRLSAVAQSV